MLVNSLTSPDRAYLQVAGAGHRIPMDEFRNALDASKTMHGLLLKHAPLEAEISILAQGP
jgi:hypothetical protein